MNFIQELDVSFTHGQENQRRVSQVDKSLFAGVAPYLTSAAIEMKVTRERPPTFYTSRYDTRDPGPVRAGPLSNKKEPGNSPFLLVCAIFLSLFMCPFCGLVLVVSRLCCNNKEATCAIMPAVTYGWSWVSRR
ncbi:unnamed protein product [Arctogadus glacialis]